jgi:kynurenine formamidase
MEKRNWSRWGADDERGAVNLLAPEQVLAACSLVQQGRVLPLARPIDSRTPTPHRRNPPAHFMTAVAGDYTDAARSARLQFSDDAYLLATHTGTHIDALAHVWYGDELYNGFSKGSIRSSKGATRCGIDKLGPIAGRGVLIDLVEVAGTDALQEDASLGANELERCLDRHGVALRPGDIVFLRTGWWSRHASSPGQDFSREPGPNLEAARWLADRDVAVVGADNFAFEALPSGEASIFPVHELLLRDCGISIIEGLALDALAQERVHEFLCVIAPLPLTAATASPVNPIAII